MLSTFTFRISDISHFPAEEISLEMLRDLPKCACVLSCFSHVQLFVTLWTVALQAPLSVGFSGQEHCSGLPCPPPEDLPDPGIKPGSLAAPVSQADSLLLSHQESPPSLCSSLFWASTSKRSELSLLYPVPSSGWKLYFTGQNTGL